MYIFKISRNLSDDIIIVGNFCFQNGLIYTPRTIKDLFNRFSFSDELKNDIESGFSFEEDWDKLAKDNLYLIRFLVAKNGRCLKELITDKEALVREEVANQGYGLNMLIDDEDEFVRETAKNKLL